MQTQTGGKPTTAGETYSLISSSKVEGTNVRRPSGDKIGEIDHVMIDKRTGKAAYAVMSFGGFLGMGEDYYPIPWEKLTYNPSLDAYELDISDNELKGAPKYADPDRMEWSRDDERRLYDYYGLTPTATI